MHAHGLTTVAVLIAASMLAPVPGGDGPRGATPPTFTQIGEIHVGGPSSFDYLNIDTAAHRLYLTHGTEVVVIDTAQNAVVGRIPAGPRVHGIAIAPNGHMDSASALTPADTIDTTRGARTMALDPATYRIYVAGQRYAPVDPNAPPPPPSGRRGRGGPPAIPDSFHVLVLGMQ